MKALAGVMKYIGIVLVCIILILAFAIGIMYFTGINLLGFYFIQVDETGKQLKMQGITLPAGYESLSENKISITLEAKNFNVKVIPHRGSDIEITCDASYIGLLRATKVNGQKKAVYMPTLADSKANPSEPSKGIFNWVITEPSGLFSMNEGSVILVKVPYESSGENKTLSNKYDLNIITKNGNINLFSSSDDDGVLPLHIDSLNLTTKKGDAIFEGLGNGGSRDVATEKVFNKLSISTQGGKFDFTQFDRVTVNDKIKLDSKKATYSFKKLRSYYNVVKDGDKTTSVSGGVEITGTKVNFTADAVLCGSDGFVYKSDTGVLKIGRLESGIINDAYYNKKNANGEEVKENDVNVTEYHIASAVPYENTIFTDSAVVDLGVVVGKMGLYNELGNVTIDLLSHQASIRTDNGDITIKSSGHLYSELTEHTRAANGIAEGKIFTETSSLILYSIYGNITVEEYYQDAVIYSKKGKITANSKYAGNADKVSTKFAGEEAERYYYTDISTKDGKVTFTTEKNPFKIIATDNAQVVFTIENVLKTEYSPFEGAMYLVETKNGKITATLPIANYIARVECKKVEGALGATSSFKNTDGTYKDVQINAQEENQPTVKLVGKRAAISSAV